MFKVSVDTAGAHFNLKVVEPGRGCWEVKNVGEWSTTLIGFDGENEVVILPTMLSDGSADIVLVMQQVDNTSRVFQARLNERQQHTPALRLNPAQLGKLITDWLNEKLESLA